MKSNQNLYTIDNEKHGNIQKPIKNKSRLQDYIDLQNQGTDKRNFEDEEVNMDKIDSNENSINAHQRAKALKRNKINKGQNSDLDVDPAQ